MKTINLIKLTAAGILTATLAMQAQAHRAWILPSSTVLSGDSPYVTFDAAISNTLFFPDHFAMNLDSVKAFGPNGEAVELLNPAKGKYRSTFDIQLKQEGTYKLATSGGGLRAIWEDEDGKRKMWPGRGQSAPDSDFATAVPKNANKLRVSRSYRRIETFVTLGAPTNEVFTPTNQGLEMVPLTHPNDLYAGEEATFKLLIDGKPAKGAKIEIIPDGVRYRDQQNEIKLTANEKGEFVVAWPTAGRYFLEAEYEDDQVAAPATKRSGSYAVTFEVLPM
ncbi:DUF4198 domain-containing protein [Aliiglaciecola lipolytica]|uniref:DUF4198 domain-containing protein n=1 Tax=Aliiglaciecola lipolytica E3 TaxID=1127673 RepID=K6Y6P5_9ALTE|nr:DUF4198 domain-containing protein [Aliiglaciecola lipolytica]GAC13887.1 hypothetical protein GLIP_1246 [Aliiglaciecola lipolytica E3]